LDNITHSLFALTVARTRLNKHGTAGTIALVLASNAPDVDIVATAGGAMSYLRWHRAVTHGPLGVIGLAAVTAALVWGFNKRRGRREAPAFLNLATLAIVGTFCHVLMDLPTSYGTRLLTPFDWHWYAADWMPIVDIYLMVALGAGLYFGSRSADARGRNIVIVLTLMVANYALRGGMHHRAIALAPRLFGQTMPPPCVNAVASASPIDRWPRSPAPAVPQGRTRCLVELAAMPSFLSPFEWRVIAQMSNGYEMQDINVLSRRFLAAAQEPEVLWRLNSRAPNIWTPEAFRAAETVTGRTFLGFSRFPAVRTVRSREGDVTVRMIDVRFITRPSLTSMPVNPPRGRGEPAGNAPPGFFSATVRFDSSGQIVDEHLGP
jgi:inner membrane protein